MNAFDHYLAVDWSQNNMAIAKMTAHGTRAEVIDVPTDIRELKFYLSRLSGRKILCFEESTPAQWLYTELKPVVDELIVCDPYRNQLLKEGGKTDKLDAIRLVKLLRAGMLKPVFHSDDSLIGLRRMVHGYLEMVRAGVRLKNQRAALLAMHGLNREAALPEDARESSFVLSGIELGLRHYESEKLRYEAEFRKLTRIHPAIAHLQTIPGIGLIGSVKILSVVIDAKRFKSKSGWLSYCGLIRHDLISGGRSYGSRQPRYNRVLKSVFKTAALSALGTRSSMYPSEREQLVQPLRRYYEELIHEKGLPIHHARHAVARRIAILALGVLRSGKPFEDRWRSQNDVMMAQKKLA